MLVRSIIPYTSRPKLTYLGVIQDAKFKRREALDDLAKAASKK
jgi:hypothetical protein